MKQWSFNDRYLAHNSKLIKLFFTNSLSEKCSSKLSVDMLWYFCTV